EQLTEAGVPLEDLKKAAEEDRLALLPVEQVLSGDARHTRGQVAKKSGLPEEFLVKQWQALGLPVPPKDEKYFSDDDLEAAKLLRDLRKAGLDDEGIHEVARVIGEGMFRVADASASLVGQTFLREANTERDLGLRYAEAARQMTPI